MWNGCFFNDLYMITSIRVAGLHVMRCLKAVLTATCEAQQGACKLVLNPDFLHGEYRLKCQAVTTHDSKYNFKTLMTRSKLINTAVRNNCKEAFDLTCKPLPMCNLFFCFLLPDLSAPKSWFLDSPFSIYEQAEVCVLIISAERLPDWDCSRFAVGYFWCGAAITALSVPGFQKFLSCAFQGDLPGKPFLFFSHEKELQLSIFTGTLAAMLL